MPVNWSRVIQAQLPQWMRRPKHISWLMALIAPVRALSGEFFQYRTRTLYDLSITPQTIYLERMLNDKYDNTERRIWIETIDDNTQLYLYNREELRPPMYIYNRWVATQVYGLDDRVSWNGTIWKCVDSFPTDAPSEASSQWEALHPHTPYFRNRSDGAVKYNFIIHLPIGLMVNEAQLRALINDNHLAGKRYIIQRP